MATRPNTDFDNYHDKHLSICDKDAKHDNINKTNDIYLTGPQVRVRIGKLFSLFLIQNILDGSFEYPKHMFKLMSKKIIKKKNTLIKFPYLDL